MGQFTSHQKSVGNQINRTIQPEKVGYLKSPMSIEEVSPEQGLNRDLSPRLSAVPVFLFSHRTPNSL